MDMESNTLVSVIIPVYNVSNYIEKCIQSVVHQTYKNIEIIIIDDGTPDDSIEKIRNYIKSDNRIKFFAKQNGGLSDARNFGMSKASGKYIYFLDSDDYIAKDTLETLVKSAEHHHAEIVQMNFINVLYKNSEYIVKNQNKPSKNIGKVTQTGIDFFINAIKKGSYRPMVWQYLYKKKVIDENDIKFVQGRIHEDELWTPTIFQYTKSVIEVDYYGYYYVQRSDSITNSLKSYKRFEDLQSHIMEIERNYRNVKGAKFILDYLARMYMGLYKLYPGTNLEFKSKFNYDFVKDNSYLFKTKLKYILHRYFFKLYKILK